MSFEMSSDGVTAQFSREKQPSICADEITALVLAGGQGARMDHADKGLVPFRGRPLVAHAIERLRPHVTAVWVSANRNADTYAGFNCEVIPDVVGGFPGPLAGLQAALRKCKTAWLVMVPCDVPLFPENLVEALGEAAQQSRADAVVVSTQGERQPVFLMLQTRLATELDTYLASGRRSAHGWLAHLTDAGCAVCDVPFPDAHNSFANVNTLAQLNQLEAED